MSHHPTTSSGRPWTPADDAQLIALLRQGWLAKEIAAALGRPVDGVSNRLTRLRHYKTSDAPPPRRHHRHPDPRIAITAEDLAWMAYWSQPRAVRRGARL